ncbi:MAG: cytochrome C oxidase subunit IV family protein [Alphaproteobacteria bacterium]|uniref:Cytochrome C oxidase subunit IV family protein n=1 Tax=Candidatus Nitrobium versatile TaxID=2884831 RepID=A0A953J6V3_9BACT|nr:cytochrome C oxidase subunit IV family protein [Candidatus Nitrobium versatile]
MERTHPGKQSPVFGYRTYFLVWGALVVLLAVTVLVARAGLTRYSVPVNFLIASLKAGLVLEFFMHLKHEDRFVKGILALGILTLTAILGLTYADTWYR